MRSETFLRLFGVTALAFVLASGVQAQQSGTQEPDQPEQPEQPSQGEEGLQAVPGDTEGAEGGETPLAIPEVPEEIDIMEGTGGFTYEARGRRDPFISLALGLNILSPDVRPPGLGGMLVQEVSLRGIVKTSEGYIAMIQGTDNKSYFAREGERMYDGTIEVIDSEKVVFRQEINDPLRIEKFQRLEKWLHPLEEGQ